MAVQRSLEPKILALNPDHRKDLKNRSPNLGPYTTKGTLKELP